MREVSLFVSSPSDVAAERRRVELVAARLSAQSGGTVAFKTFLWENDVYNAHDGFQDQIDRRTKPEDCDLVLGILWGRVGSPLPETFPHRLADGRPYPSGTAYELLRALEAQADRGRPDVYVLTKTAKQMVALDDVAAWERARQDRERLGDFLGTYFRSPDRGVLRADEPFEGMEDFAAKVERILRRWMADHVPSQTVWPIDTKGSPFRGLAPFDARHAAVFRGRDRKVARAVEEFKAAARRGKPFLLIPGTSGAGKSSLMRAGLTPRLIEPGAVEDVDLWRVAVTRPAWEKDPFESLAKALFVAGDAETDDVGGFGPALPELAAGAFKTADDLAALFRSGDGRVAAAPLLAALDDVAEAERRRRGFERPVAARLLLLVDQLEEVFSDGFKEVRGPFAALLTALVGTGRVWVCATVRADLYEHVITERPFIALKDLGGQYDLGPPGPDELDEIVHQSAEAAGLTFGTRTVADAGDGVVEERLDDRLLADASGGNMLPLLQFTLELLFQECWGRRRSTELTFEAYEAIGGVDGAIDRTAEVALVRLVRPRGDLPAFPWPEEIEREIAVSVGPALEALLRKLVVPVGRVAERSDPSEERSLTSAMVPLSEACQTAAGRRLVDALLAARILAIAKASDGPRLQIAHDRVLKSWRRAAALVEKNETFYRVQEDVQQYYLRWLESRRSTERLVPAGVPLVQAEDVIRRFPEEFAAGTREFVELSGRRARWRQRLTATAAVVFGAVAVMALVSLGYAQYQRDRATENYTAARGTVGGLVAGLANGLRNTADIRSETVEKALTLVNTLVEKLEAQSGDDPEMRRVHASLHYEFADVFYAQRALEPALREAEAGLVIRRDLASSPDAPVEWRAELAESLDQINDILRRGVPRSDQTPEQAATLRRASAAADEAFAIRQQLHDADPLDPRWRFALSQSLVRQGDLLRDTGEARALFEDALALMKTVVARDPSNLVWERELSWGFNKVGDESMYAKKPEEALPLFERGLCIRRHLCAQDDLNALWKQDLAYSLQKTAAAYLALGQTARAEQALFEELRLRRRLHTSDLRQLEWAGELGTTLHRIGQFYARQGNPGLAAGFYQRAADIRQYVVEMTPGSATDVAASGGDRKNYQLARDRLAESLAERDKAVAEGREEQDPQTALAAFEHAADEREHLISTDLVLDTGLSWETLLAELAHEETIPTTVAR